MMEATRGGPLAGLRVLDLTSIVMGPYATQILADYGAEIITIETLDGRGNRTMGEGRDPQFSGTALNLLRNKRMVALDLKDSAARDAVLAIARTCDAFVTNLRPKPLARLGLAYEDVSAVRPDIVFCQAQGFRSDQPRADDPAYDDIIQAESGIADAARQTTGEPKIAPTIMADKVCGMAIASAVTAAFVHRFRTGQGQRVEVPMADVMKSFVLVEHGDGAISDDAAPAGYRRVLNPERGPQRTADGWINILPYSTSAYDDLFGRNGRPEMIGDERTHVTNLQRNARELYAELRPIIATRTTAEWLAFCHEHSIPVGRVVSLDDLVRSLPTSEHPVVGTYRVIPAPIWFSAAGAQTVVPARRLGEDTRSVLQEVGLRPEAIDDLLARGVATEPRCDPTAAGKRQ
ncbi:MAG: CoA transferase [Bradyrhizobium sp.]|nr:CoA transferase [Bradyrhizobium sp.]